MTATSPVAVVARGLVFAYGERVALGGVDLDVQAGEAHGLLGPNGSGKSTLFKLLSTLVPLQQGSATLLGLDLARQPAAIRRRIGVVFQSPAVDRQLSVHENLRYAALLLGLGGAAQATAIDRTLEAAGLRERRADRVGELSGGLRRRVEIAKCLLAEPELLLLDEASTGLDPAARRDVWRVLRAQSRLTVLFTTHLMDEAAEADRLTLLDEGKVVATGSPKELMREVGDQVLEIDARDAAGLCSELRAGLGVSVEQVEETLRIEGENVHRLVPQLMERYGERIGRLQLAHPSLQDVFLRKTGKRFAVAEPDPVGGGRGRRAGR